MPSYTITDPTSGKKVTLTGDSPPSEVELNDIFSKIPGGTPWTPTKEDFKQHATNLATEYKLDPEIFHKVVGTESSWDKDAKSQKGAEGLGQLMPGTAKEMGVNPKDPLDNLRGSAKYLKENLDKFGGNYSLALAAYNAGPGAVAKAGGIPNFKETKDYVAKIMAAVKGAKEYATGEMPDNKLLSKEYMTENVPRSLARFPVAAAAGTGGMLYDAAKQFTDPVVNAWSGKQPLDEAAGDLLQAPSNVVTKVIAPAARQMLVPLGWGEKGETKAAWNDPAMAAASVAPMIDLGVMGGRMALAKSPESLGKEFSKVVETGIDRGVKPGFKGNKTFKQSKDFYRKADNAVESLVTGKNALQLTDDIGEVVPGTLPSNLKQFSQAISQGKETVWAKSNAMAEAAGEAGATIPAAPIAKELKPITENVAIKDFAPEVSSYAEKRIMDLELRGEYKALDAQEALKVLNQSLEAYYQSPSSATAGKAYVDAVIANNLRKQLDSVIESYSGPGYQQLKNEYGSLKSLEESVNRAVRRDKNSGGGVSTNFTHIFSGTQAVSGILSFHPSHIGTAAAAEGMMAYIKHMRDPNRHIKNMFEKADSIITARELAGQPVQSFTEKILTQEEN